MSDRFDPPRLAGRIFIVEDEVLIAMLLEDMLGDLGYQVAGTASRLDEAIALARDVAADLAILDVNLDGRDVFPVADVLAERTIPFLFATGYGEHVLPEPYQQRPMLQKPFEQETLERELARLLKPHP